MPEGAVQFPPPPGLVGLLLSGDQIADEIPEITTYARRPVFDHDFNLCGPGWYPESGILVQGIEINIGNYDSPDTSLPAIERLPYHLRHLLAGFPFRSYADVANALLAFVTGLLANLFVIAGKGIPLIDANQPGLGKTWLARVLGIVLDGRDPQLVTYTPDDAELRKQCCATLRTPGQSILLIDNARPGNSTGCINSTFIEANSLASTISLRILGTSENFTRPNDVLWCITMNGTRATPDLVSRSYPVRLHFDGDPARRPLPAVDPIRYAHDHRDEILGELASMVICWKQQSCPDGTTSHRCATWAKICGGIVASAGFPEVLTNLGEAAAQFDVGQDELAALAEVVLRQLRSGGDGLQVPSMLLPQPARRAGEWYGFFRDAGILQQKLGVAKSNQGRSTIIGSFMGAHVGRVVTLEQMDPPLRATLRAFPARANTTTYAFEFMAVDVPDVATIADASDRDGNRPLEAGCDECRPGESDAASNPTSSTGDSLDAGGHVGNAEQW